MILIVGRCFILDDVTESNNLYGDSTPDIQSIQADLEKEVRIQRRAAVPSMSPYTCNSPNNELDGFYTAGAGEGWCGCTQ